MYKAGFADSSYAFIKVPLMLDEMVLQDQAALLKHALSHKPVGRPRSY